MTQFPSYWSKNLDTKIPWIQPQRDNHCVRWPISGIYNIDLFQHMLYVCMHVMHTYSYSNSKTLCSKAISQNMEKSEGHNAEQLLPSKTLTSLVHCKKLVFFLSLGRNATTLPSSFIRNQWKQKVKTDPYSSPCIGQKTVTKWRKNK